MPVAFVQPFILLRFLSQLPYFLYFKLLMRIIFFIISLIFSAILPLQAQFQNNVWCFGMNAGLDFNSIPPSTFVSKLSIPEGSASISDPSGQLLFYTDGLSVYDRNHHLMPNGTGLIGGYSSTQSALIAPLPNSISKYFIFTTQDHQTDGGLSYSIVDMTLNGGLGDIDPGTKNTFVVNMTSEKITSVKHSNGKDIWIITHTMNSDEFLAYLLTSSGLSSIPVVSSIGSFYPEDSYFGPIKSSHNGSHIVAANTEYKQNELFDFNSTTGEITNLFDLNELFKVDESIYGIEFSPNDSLLYLTTFGIEGPSRLLQIDLYSGEVFLVTSIMYWNTDGALQMGPDQKIYMAINSPLGILDVIHQPNRRGVDCQYEGSGVSLSPKTRAIFGLPNPSLYSFFLPRSNLLGSDTVVCDGSIVELSVNISKECNPVSILWNDGSTDLSRSISLPGTYWVSLESGCGSTVDTIQIGHISCVPIVYYDLEACASYMTNGSNMDYSEFTPAYPIVLACADVNATNIFRSPPQENKHSCTAGVNNDVAMCISSYSSCTYEPGHLASLVTEIVINPLPDSVVMLTGLEFYEKAPPTYAWIDGGSGLNNYPTRYGIRILKDGTEIYQNEDISTSPGWTLQSFDFLNDRAFKVTDTTLFRIELLPYCPVGNGAEVAAWDIDEIRLFGGCLPLQNSQAAISGHVYSIEGKPLAGVEMRIAGDTSFDHALKDTTDESGFYSFDHLTMGRSYYVNGNKNDDVLYGVSALDLIQIQKHLLGISPFASLPQYIAADVNHSGMVSVIDLVSLQKVLLGIYTEFPGNTSWRFGFMPQDMEGQDINGFKEIYTIESLQGQNLTIDFVGIKIGDLTGDARMSIGSPK